MNPYLPRSVKVIERIEEVEGIVRLKLRLKLDFMPGQFVQAGVPGMGEAPFAIASAPKQLLELGIARMGNVTTALCKVEEGERVWIRGPYGNGFPLSKLKGKNLVLVAGGVGITSLRSVLQYALTHKRYFGDTILIYGAKTPDKFIYKDEFSDWSKRIQLLLTVDKATPGWKGRVGLVTQALDELKLQGYAALLCGPDLMLKFCVQKLLEKGLTEQDIYLALSRKMQCGLGVCGHCNINGLRVCKEGPVLSFAQVKDLPELWPC